jgi:transposase
VVFDFTTTHQRDGPAAFLKDYHGYLQADAFNGYDGIYLESHGRIIEVGCWAHARRKFHESRQLDPARTETALAWIGKLYAVEKDLRERCQGQWAMLSWEERATRIAAERQQRSRPLLEGFRTWLETEAPKVLPKSDVRGAMDYTLNNWAALCVYTQDGWLDIDNNEGENSIRGLCIGRRNWLFMGSDRGGRAAAVHFSLLASCKRHGHDPWAYYREHTYQPSSHAARGQRRRSSVAPAPYLETGLNLLNPNAACGGQRFVIRVRPDAYSHFSRGKFSQVA